MKNSPLVVFLQFVLFSSYLFSQAPPDFYCLQSHFGQFYRADMDSANVAAMLDLVQAAGFRSIRDECYWSEVEKTRGIYDFPGPIDYYIHSARERGIDVLLILNYNNPLYAPHAGSAVTTDSNRVAFARYCQQVVKRYAPLGIKYYEIWNEPNIPIFWDPAPNALDYVKLLQIVYPAIKDIDSTVTVIGCATSPAEGNPPPFIDWLTFITRVFQAGGGNYLDGVSYHSYHVDQAPEVNFFRDIQKLQAIIGKDLPLWLTEIGYPTNTGWPNLSLEQQANYLARLFLLGKTENKLKRICYYDLKNDGQTANQPEHNFGVLFFNLQPKPAYFALKTVTTLVRDKPIMGQTITNDDYLVEFGDKEDWVLAGWHSRGKVSRTIKIKGPYCSIFNRDGTKENHFISSDSLVPIELGDSPRYLCGLPSAPVVTFLNLQPNRVILSPGQSFEIRASGMDTAGIPISFSLPTLHWDYFGTGGSIDSLGTFNAVEAGAGLLIGSYQGLKDTIFVEIFNPGTHVIDDFTSTGWWHLSTLNLDSVSTNISISRAVASTGTTSARIDYLFNYKSTIPTSQYRVYLENELLLPGQPDSLLIDFYGNGQPHRLRFQLSDAFGEQFIRSVTGTLNWQDTWKTTKISLKNLTGQVDYPLSLNQVTIYIGQDNAQNDSTYGGSIYLDNLRAKSSQGTGIPERRHEKPNSYQLYQNYPNPFNPTTIIGYQLEQAQMVTLKVFNMLGQEVMTLVDEFQMAGSHQVQFAGKDLPSGLYFCKLKAGEFYDIKKMVFLK